MRYLLFQICAPYASFGNEGARAERPTDTHPRKSMIMGFLGAALGLGRLDPWFGRTGLRMATAQLRLGGQLSDYHTVATPPGKDTYLTRAEELLESSYTIQTYRDYVVDYYGLIAIWAEEGAPIPLERLKEALEDPVFELFVGRKCNTLSLPPAPRIVEANTLVEAFQQYDLVFTPIFKEGDVLIRWEDHPAPGLEATFETFRSDERFGPRQYGTRREYTGSAKFVFAKDEKEGSCT